MIKDGNGDKMKTTFRELNAVRSKKSYSFICISETGQYSGSWKKRGTFFVVC